MACECLHLLSIGFDMVTRLVALLLAVFGLSVSLAGAEPKVRVENIRRAFHNGEHNAFTDLIRWRDRYLAHVSQLPGRTSGCGVGVGDRAVEQGCADVARGASLFRAGTRYARSALSQLQGQAVRLYGHLVCRRGGAATRAIRDQPAPRLRCLDGRRQNMGGPRQLEGTYGHYIWRGGARWLGLSLREAEGGVFGSRKRPGRLDDHAGGTAGERRWPDLALPLAVSGDLGK